MTKRMLIDSTNAEETRVVVLDGNRLEEFDVETSTKKQLKGNIYLAKIVRVEPSLQAAFVEFGGGRHGFLAFGEIHPDYYQIPVADRKRLLELQEAEAREEEEAEDRAAAREEAGEPPESEPAALDVPPEPEQDAEPAAADELTQAAYAEQADPEAAPVADDPTPMPRPEQVAQPAAITADIAVAPEEAQDLFAPPPSAEEAADTEPTPSDMFGAEPEARDMPFDTPAEASEPAEAPDGVAGETELDAVGGETETDEAERPERRSAPRFLRNYKIQEVIRRRQILLVQVVKEERGNKGAALTTYISLAGRFSVLMPNSPRGGGISRKITSAADRRRLKEVTAELDLPRGMGLIVRTAGANRPKAEILRDGEYLLGQWDQIRDLTMQSMAPALIYEEASLIKRAIRDLYSRDVDDITVDGEQGWRAARDFMRMLMPSHVKKVQFWREPQPLFAKAQVEAQLDGMLQPVVQLRSGGYLVINQTEALVAIDVNSGRSTRERGIEETAVRTNLEAAEEAARQLRLRDLAGLIVIDFIDMESRRNNVAVEKRLKDALRHDRARIQVGSISHFGLLEMSRQRLRPSLTETAFVRCPHCGGSGHVRSTESAALAVLRGIEEEGAKRRAAEIVVHVAGSVALYILNHKRDRLAEIETRFGLRVTFNADEGLRAPDMRIERIRALSPSDTPLPVTQLAPPPDMEDEEEDDMPEEEEAEAGEPAAASTTADEKDDGQRRRRRRRRGGRRDETGTQTAPEPVEIAAEAALEADEPGEPEDTAESETDASLAERAEVGAEGERKRRGRRGGRRRRRSEPGTEEAAASAPEAAPPAPVPERVPERMPERVYAPVYVGPTPADPFGGANVFDFFDAVEQMEAAPPPRREPASPSTSNRAEPERTDNYDPSIAGPAPELDGAETSTPATTPQTTPQPELDGAEVIAPETVPAPAYPAIQPVLVGGDDAAPAEKKRGWWRR